MTTLRERRLAYGAWIAICLIWGTTYLAIKVCLETIPPTLMGGVRYVLAGALLGVVLRARGTPLPKPESWGRLAVLGFLMLGLGNGGVVWGERWVSSGVAAVIIGASPFWMVGIEALLPRGDRLTRWDAAGLALGFAGIVLLVWPDLRATSVGSRGFLWGVVALQIACAGWALGSVYSRRHSRHEDVLAGASLEMIFGGAALLVAGTLLGEWDQFHFSARSLVAFVHLVTFGAAGGFAAYAYALKHLPVSTVSTYAYINPVIAMALGALVLREPFTLRMAIATAIIIAGVAIVRGGQITAPRFLERVGWRGRSREDRTVAPPSLCSEAQLLRVTGDPATK